MLSADRILPPLVPGSPEWRREMTASKAAAVLGLSPYVSPFTLWHQMAGDAPEQPATPAMERGHYLEDAIAQWAADKLDCELTWGGCWRNRDRPWQVASPDRMVVGTYGEGVLEVKTAADFEDWGPEGTDLVPPHYRCQVVYQLDTLGLEYGYIAVLLPRLTLRLYEIRPAIGEAEYIREEAYRFLLSLAEGVEPPLDVHKTTYPTLRALNPRVEDRTVELEPALAARYSRAVLGLRRAEDEHTMARSLIAAAMGSAKRAVDADTGDPIAVRQLDSRGNPYVKAANRLPVYPSPEEITSE